MGNYILAEGLYRARIDPFCALSELSLGQRQKLFAELRAVASSSYRAQGLTRPNGGNYRGVDGSRGEYEFQLQCYGQTSSPTGFPVARDTDGPHRRTIWYVEEEQLFMPRFQRELKLNGETTTAPRDAKQDESEKDLSATNAFHESSSSEASYIFSEIPRQLTDGGWKARLSEHMKTESFQSLLTKVQLDASSGAVIYPPVQDIFSALNLCPLENVVSYCHARQLCRDDAQNYL